MWVTGRLMWVVKQTEVLIEMCLHHGNAGSSLLLVQGSARESGRGLQMVTGTGNMRQHLGVYS